MPMAGPGDLSAILAEEGIGRKSILWSYVNHFELGSQPKLYPL